MTNRKWLKRSITSLYHHRNLKTMRRTAEIQIAVLEISPWFFCREPCSSVRKQRTRTLLNYPEIQSGIKYWIFSIKSSKLCYIHVEIQNNKEHFLVEVSQQHLKKIWSLHAGNSLTPSTLKRSKEQEWMSLWPGYNRLGEIKQLDIK